MEKIKIAVAGLGNVGQAVCDCVLAAPDMELRGIVRRKAEGQTRWNNIEITEDISSLGHIDAAILAGPSRSVGETAEKYLKMGINTVDSFDIHSEIWRHKTALDAVAKEYNAVSIVSAGWDPGSDSIIRALMLAMAPKGITHTNFGPGMSMGHTVAVKAVKGVKSALSITVPAGSGRHDRLVYIEAEEGGNREEIAERVKADPYFINDDTRVVFTDDVDALLDMGHGVYMIRKGAAGSVHNQVFEYKMSVNNPSLTAQIMVSCARASMRREKGCYTMIELPVIDLLPGTPEQLISKLV